MAYRPAPIGPKTLVLSDRARADVEGYTLHIAQSDGMEAALRFADRIDDELSKLARIGHSGVSREEISAGLRLHVIDKFCVYFRVTETETRVSRFLRSSMDIEPIDFGHDP